MLENKNEADVLREGPYLASLAASGATLTDMHAETHPSQPNYLALFSGDTQGVDDDRCPLTFDAPNLATELAAAGHSFAGYSEDLPEVGFTGCRAGEYARKHSPWTDFSTVPPAANQPLSAMPTDYAALPTISFVIPNLCHDMHDCSIAQGDAWLRQNIDGYAQWARTHNSLLIVSFDESESNRDRDNHIATLAVGQRVPVGPIPQHTDHYGCCGPWRIYTAYRRWVTVRRPWRWPGCGAPTPDRERSSWRRAQIPSVRPVPTTRWSAPACAAVSAR